MSIFEKVIYEAIITPASQSPDGECPETITLTEEENGYGLFHVGYEGGARLIKYFVGKCGMVRYTAIEEAVEYASKQRKE